MNIRLALAIIACAIFRSGMPAIVGVVPAVHILGRKICADDTPARLRWVGIRGQAGLAGATTLEECHASNRNPVRVLALEKKYWDALKSRDLPTMEALTADPCLLVGPQGASIIDRASSRR